MTTESTDRLVVSLRAAADAFRSQARNTIVGFEVNAKSLELELGRWRSWEDAKDEWSDAIHAAHPTRSGSHKEYETALTMVGNRHSKGALVALVNWLLVERKAERTKFAEAVARRIRDLNAEAEGASPTAVTIIRIRIDELQKVAFYLQERP